MTLGTSAQGLDTGSVDGEHAIQLKLVSALRDALAQERSTEEIDSILEQLADYTNVHFLSEELLMRLHSYPGYHAHEEEHRRLLEQFEEMRRTYLAGNREETIGLVESVGQWLSGHIGGPDRTLTVFMARGNPPAP